MSAVLGAGLYEIISALIGVVGQFISRGQQTGALTDTQAADLQAKAISIFMKYSVAPPPPPGA